MSRIIDRINSLIERAAHDGTPPNEASSCALIAVKLIKRNNLKIVDEAANDISTSYDQDDGSYIDVNNFTQEVQTFNVAIAKTGGKCVACNKPYPSNVIVAKAANGNIAHYECKRFFVDEKV